MAKRSRPVLVVLVSLVAALSAACGLPTAEADVAEEPYTYRPGQGEFNVEFPAPPDVAPIEQELPDGQMVKGTQATIEVGDAHFEATAAAFPVGAPMLPLNQGLNGARDGALRAIEATLGDSEPVAVGDYDGLRFTFSVDGKVGEAATFIAGRQMYLVAAVGEPETRTRLAAFVDSVDFSAI